MANMIATERSNIVAIAEAVRNKTGNNGDMTLNDIIENINELEVGSGEDIVGAICNGTITECNSDSAQTIKPYMFQNCSNLTTIDFPACTSIGS